MSLQNSVIPSDIKVNFFLLGERLGFYVLASKGHFISIDSVVVQLGTKKTK